MVKRISDGLTYMQRHNKRYKAPLVNAKQTPERRRQKYNGLRAKGLSRKNAQQFRDFDEGLLKTLGFDV